MLVCFWGSATGLVKTVWEQACASKRVDMRPRHPHGGSRNGMYCMYSHARGTRHDAPTDRMQSYKIFMKHSRILNIYFVKPLVN